MSDDQDETQKVNPRLSDKRGSGSTSPLYTDRKPRLYLERTPSAAKPYAEEEFDEMIPEFMHRDFYRSTEGDVEAVQVAGRLRSSRSRLKSPAPEPIEPLRAPERRPPRRSDPLTPLRGRNSAEHSGQADLDDTIGVDDRTMGVGPISGRRYPAPPEPVRKSSINFPLVVCLLLLVGLFLWREQTRPRMAEQQDLPLPREVKVVKEIPKSTDLEATSPYPGMEPQESAEKPAVNSEDAALEQEFATNPPARPEREPAESTETSTNPQSTEEAAAQRAAILERVSEGTVSRSDRETRIESAAPPSADDSLFPDVDEPEVEQAEEPSTVTEPVEAAAEPPKDDESLFPSDAVAQPTNSDASTAPTETQKPPPAVQGEPYEIAEPDL